MGLVKAWTGRTACALQEALRLSNELFAERLGVHPGRLPRGTRSHTQSLIPNGSVVSTTHWSTRRRPATYRTIAVDGADGTGKTTLVNLLQAEHGFTVVHCGRTPDDVDLIARYRQILAVPGPLTLDRCFISELVYGPLYRGRSRLTWDDALDLAQVLIARQACSSTSPPPPRPSTSVYSVRRHST